MLELLEEKGANENILLYNELKSIKLRQFKKSESRLDFFHKQRHEDNLIDSAFVVYGKIIMEYVKSFIEKKKAKEQLKQMRESRYSNFFNPNEETKIEKDDIF